MNNYNGTDNLNIMEEAVNYNHYLTNLVMSHREDKHTILDFGAGIGTFAEKITLRNNKLSCIEIDPKQAEIIYNKGIPVYTDLSMIEDNSLDFIYSLNVLEHIEDDMDTLSSLKKKLKLGGHILIYVPALQCLYSSMDKKVGHYRRYSRKELEKKCMQAGFTVKSSRYVDFVGVFASLIYKFLDNGKGDIDIRKLHFYDRYVFPISRLLDKATQHTLGKNVFIYAQN
jgi:SAM-dependent methyltransferase